MSTVDTPLAPTVAELAGNSVPVVTIGGMDNTYSL